MEYQEKNLFDYAYKELSQDGFIDWLLNSFNVGNNPSEEGLKAKEVSKKFIEFLCKDIKVDDIKKVNTWRQRDYIDLSASFEMKDESVYGLAIEDKTTSGEHNQLEKYNKCIDNWKTLVKVFRIFYKTCSKDFIWDRERETVKNAGWNYLDLETINAFWKQYLENENMVIRMYAQHLSKLLERYNNRYLPEVNDPDSIKWEGFFKGVRERELKDKSLQTWTGQTNYSYSCICFRPGEFKDKKDGETDVPYLEIRSRDCCWSKDNKDKEKSNVRYFRALILRYYDFDGQHKIDQKADFEDITDRIKKDESNPDGMVFKKSGSYPKKSRLVGQTKNWTYTNEKEFIDNLNKALDRYLKIMEGYKPHFLK